MTPAERDKFESLALEFWRGYDRGAPVISSLSRLSAYVDSLLAAERAAMRERCAVACDALAQQYGHGAMDRGDQEAWCEASGMTVCAAAIRALPDEACHAKGE